MVVHLIIVMNILFPPYKFYQVFSGVHVKFKFYQVFRQSSLYFADLSILFQNPVDFVMLSSFWLFCLFVLPYLL